MDEGLIDALTAHMHDAWVESNPDLPRYDGASEHIREGARVMVRAALAGIERAGYRLVKDAGVRTYPAPVTLYGVCGRIRCNCSAPTT